MTHSSEITGLLEAYKKEELSTQDTVEAIEDLYKPKGKIMIRVCRAYETDLKEYCEPRCDVCKTLVPAFSETIKKQADKPVWDGKGCKKVRAVMAIESDGMVATEMGWVPKPKPGHCQKCGKTYKVTLKECPHCPKSEPFTFPGVSSCCGGLVIQRPVQNRDQMRRFSFTQVECGTCHRECSFKEESPSQPSA